MGRFMMVLGVAATSVVAACMHSTVPQEAPVIAADVRPMTDVPIFGRASLVDNLNDTLRAYIEVLPADLPPLAAEARRGDCSSLIVLAGLVATNPDNRFRFEGNIEGRLESTPPVAIVLLDASTGTVIACGAIAVGMVNAPSARPVPSAVPTASFPAEIDGHAVYTVSKLLAGRAEGHLTGGPIALAGYWSYPWIVHTCETPSSPPGELEIDCHDGEFGITEFDEPSAELTEDVVLRRADGPVLTPWVPEALFKQMVFVPVDGVPYPPVPIVVLGHFDDPRAANCRPQARQLCLDRFVIDELLEFDPAAVQAPGGSPMP